MLNKCRHIIDVFKSQFTNQFVSTVLSNKRRREEKYRMESFITITFWRLIDLYNTVIIDYIRSCVYILV